MCRITPSRFQCEIFPARPVNLLEVLAMRSPPPSPVPIYPFCTKHQVNQESMNKDLCRQAANPASVQTSANLPAHSPALPAKTAAASTVAQEVRAVAAQPALPPAAAAGPATNTGSAPASANAEQQTDMLARMEASALAAIEMQARSTELTNKLGALKSAASVRTG